MDSNGQTETNANKKEIEVIRKTDIHNVKHTLLLYLFHMFGIYFKVEFYGIYLNSGLFADIPIPFLLSCLQF